MVEDLPFERHTSARVRCVSFAGRGWCRVRTRVRLDELLLPLRRRRRRRHCRRLPPYPLDEYRISRTLN